jgi:hypothetical protein
MTLFLKKHTATARVKHVVERFIDHLNENMTTKSRAFLHKNDFTCLLLLFPPRRRRSRICNNRMRVRALSIAGH